MKRIVLIPFSILFVLIILEILLRVHFHIQDPVVQAKKTSVQNVKVYGWDVRPDHEYKIHDSGFYKVNDGGFRFAPEAHDEKKKTILLIGDSFTHAPEIANENVYYAPLNDLKVNFYSYGVVGWGNLQQQMKVESVVERLQPDILIWQFSANDLIENVLAIESRLGKKSFGRPYLSKEDEIIYDTNKSLISKIRMALRESRAISFLFNRAQTLGSSKEIKLTSEEIQTTREITQLIMKRMKKILPRRSQIISFNAGPLPFEGSLFFEIATREEHFYIYDIESLIKQSKQKKADLFAADMFHWNVKGHQEIAKVLTPKVKLVLEDIKSQ